MTRFKDHFSAQASGYASYRPHYPAELADWLASAAPEKNLAWDAACGSGQLSTLLGDRFAKVIATDASAAQVAEAEAHPRVEYRVEAAETTSIPAGTVHLVTVAQAAHWLDLPAFHEEARRVAVPNGIIALIAYGLSAVDAAVDDIVRRFYEDVLEPYWPPERRHIETAYQDLPFPFPRIDVPRFEMRHSWTVDEMNGYVGTWSAVRAMERSAGPIASQQFAAALREAWGSDARTVTWPLVVLAGRLA